MIARKGKYTPGKVYNAMKLIFIKNWESKSVLGFNSSEEIPNFTYHDITEGNMRCDICIRELWNYTLKNWAIEGIKFFVSALNKPDISLEFEKHS